LETVVCPNRPLKVTQNQSKLRSGRHSLHSGGIDRAFRCICVISAIATDLPAAQKCQFGGLLPNPACHFSGKNAICDRRECKCSSNCNIYSI